MGSHVGTDMDIDTDIKEETYYKELDHTVTETEKGHTCHLQAGDRPQRTTIIQSKCEGPSESRSEGRRRWMMQVDQEKKCYLPPSFCVIQALC